MGYTIDRINAGTSLDEADARIRKALADHGFGLPIRAL